MTSPSLFGIINSNRDFTDPYYWGKNQFNSSFPVALACYMAAQNIAPVLISYLNAEMTRVSEISVANLFGSNLQPSELFFSFETRFDAHRAFIHDDLNAIDLIVCEGNRECQKRPLEIKLTTLPDNSTEALGERSYGTEIVIRSATMRYLALSMASSSRDHFSEIKQIFEPAMALVREWDSVVEMTQRAPKIIDALLIFLDRFESYQTPLLMQPIWKTQGKTSKLAENCLDMFVWTDFALTHLFLESARNSLGTSKISRQLRAALRLSRFLYSCASAGRVHQAPIYDGMTYDNQNDKEFSISGLKSRPLMACDRLVTPIIKRGEIKNIVLGGGHKYLSPERRFDAILYFSHELFENGDTI